MNDRELNLNDLENIVGGVNANLYEVTNVTSGGLDLSGVDLSGFKLTPLQQPSVCSVCGKTISNVFAGSLNGQETTICPACRGKTDMLDIILKNL